MVKLLQRQKVYENSMIPENTNPNTKE
jgi:hypothetical protein